ncbi:MAG: winged helix-turn-helix domain-containing protein [Janthinobacterium lividum]
MASGRRKNRCFDEKLVETTAGGSNGGALVTDYGRHVLSAYRELEAALVQAAGDHPRLAELEALMRDVPLT